MGWSFSPVAVVSSQRRDFFDRRHNTSYFNLYHIFESGYFDYKLRAWINCKTITFQRALPRRTILMLYGAHGGAPLFVAVWHAQCIFSQAINSVPTLLFENKWKLSRRSFLSKTSSLGIALHHSGTSWLSPLSLCILPTTSSTRVSVSVYTRHILPWTLGGKSALL